MSVKKSITWLLYGASAILAMAGMTAMPQIQKFISQRPLLTVISAIIFAALVPKIVEKIPGD